MSIRIDGTNTTANPGITGGDADTGLQFGTDEVSIVTGGTEQVKVDSSGNVGLGTSSPSQLLELNSTNASGGVGLNITNQGDGGTTTTPYAFINARLNAVRNGGEIRFGREANYGSAANADSYMAFYTAADDVNNERARIDSSGRLLVGLSSYSTSNPGVVIYNPGGDSGRIDVQKTQSGTLDSITNFHNGSYVGGLVYTNTATSLVTSSDVRLKKDIIDAPSATSVLNQIRIVSHGWVNDDSQVQYGVIAQELYQTVPDAVRVGDDGEKVEKTWGVDYSKLVPVLTKALQEAFAKIETQGAAIAALEAKVTVLEATP